MAAAGVIASATAFRDNVNWSSRTSKKNTSSKDALETLLHDAFGPDFMQADYKYGDSKTYSQTGIWKDKKPTDGPTFNAYPGDEGQAGGTSDVREEELPDAEDDSDERAETLRQARQARLEVPETAVKQLPEDIARIVERFGIDLRSVWQKYDRETIAKLTETANEMIRDAKPKFDFKLEGQDLCGHISRVRQFAWVWKNKKVNNDRLATEAGQAVCFEMLALLKQLASSGMHWKTILPDSTHKVLVTIVEESALTTEIEKKLVGYINENYTLPSNCQASAANSAQEALTNFFQGVDEGDSKKSEAALSNLQSVNSSITSTNVAIGYRKNDHHLPIKFLEKMFENLPAEDKARKEYLAVQKAIHNALFSLLGFTALAELIVVPTNIPPTKLTAEHQQYVSQLCLEWESFTKDNEGPTNPEGHAEDFGQSQGSTRSGDNPGPSSADTSQSSATNSGEEQASNGATPGAPTGSHGGPDAAAAPGQESTPRTAPSDAPPQGATDFGNSQDQHANQSTTKDSTFQHGFRGGNRPGPCFDDGITFLGKVVAAQKVGFGYRVIVNCALDSFPVYKCYPGKQFGRGTAAEMASTHPMPAKQNLKARKATHIASFLGIFEVEGSGKVRQPITMMRVRWRHSNDPQFKDAPEEEWLTRSDVISICGDDYAERMRKSLLSDRAYNLEHLRQSKEKGLHPETAEPLKESERERTPWLFPDDTAHRQQGKKSSAKEDDGNDTSHIPVGGPRFGADNGAA